MSVGQSVGRSVGLPILSFRGTAVVVVVVLLVVVVGVVLALVTFIKLM